MPFAPLSEAYQPIVPNALEQGIIDKPHIVENNQNGERQNYRRAPVMEPNGAEGFTLNPRTVEDYYGQEQPNDAPVAADSGNDNYYSIDFGDNFDEADSLFEPNFSKNLSEKIKLKCRSYMNHFNTCKECKLRVYNQLLKDPEIMKHISQKVAPKTEGFTNSNPMSNNNILLVLAIGILLIYVLDTFVKLGAYMKK